MTTYKAIVTDKETKQKRTVTIEARTKNEAIHDMRRNGYAVNPIKVKKESVFEYIMNKTECREWDWKENN